MPVTENATAVMVDTIVAEIPTAVPIAAAAPVALITKGTNTAITYPLNCAN
jgi:hypothetical protein